MAQTGAAREPTMEEILASIRRIIESNDGAETVPNPRPQLESVAGGRAADEPPIEPAANEPVQDEPPMTAVPEPRQQMEAAPARAISLADVAARLRNNSGGTSGPVAEPVEPAAEAATAFDAVEADPEERAEPQFDEAEAAGDAMPETAAETADAFEPEQASDVPASHAHDELRSGDDREQFDVPHVDTPSDTSVHDEQAAAQRMTALISTEASAKVAAAFEDLNDAVLKGQMRSFEDIAQDMLRPMLREWLDDNLPTLVERLVREEIERVARGGRR